MVIGGWIDPIRTAEVEIIDLDNPSATCPSVQDYEIGINRLTATYIDGKVLACGGLDIFGTSWSCFELGQDLLWYEINSMPTGVNHDMKSSNIDGQWVMTGGDDNPSVTLISQDGILTQGPRLPANKHESIVMLPLTTIKYLLPLERETQTTLKVESKHLSLTGGQRHGRNMKNYQTLDWTRLRTCEQRNSCCCG